MSSPAERYARAQAKQQEPTELVQFRSQLDFPLDSFQEEACRALAAGEGVLVAAPTGSGKTVVGEFAIHLALAAGKRCFYTTPIKALSNQKFLEFGKMYGPDNVGLLTGDNSVNSDAPVIVMTTEILRNMLYAKSHDLQNLDHVVMDEVHYLANRERGAVWEEVLITLPTRVTVTALSATVSNAEEFGNWLSTVRGATKVVVEESRPVPLHQHVLDRRELYDLFVQDGKRNEVNPDLLQLARNRDRAARRQTSRRERGRQRGRQNGRVNRPQLVTTLRRQGLLPAIDFIFSRQGCDDAVDQCLRGHVVLTSQEQADEIAYRAEEACADVPPDDLAALNFGSWVAALQNGIAAHHAGMVPVFKELVEELFAKGLVQMVFATETLALGINMPARSVVLERLVKWNGESHVDLSAGEYTQITGRAGRRGIDVEGHAVVAWGPQLDVRWLAGLASTRTYPLVSSFQPSYNMAVNLVGTFGQERAVALLETSFAQFQADASVVDLAAELRRNTDRVATLSAECELGDVGEYFAMRRELTELERATSRKRSHPDFDPRLLVPGEVVYYQTGRRPTIAVVVENGYELVVVDVNNRTRVLEADDLLNDRPGRIKFTEDFHARSANHRKPVVAQLRDLARSHPHQRDPSADNPEIANLRQSLRAHACHQCPDREEHARVLEEVARLERRNNKLSRRINKKTGNIALTFQRICAVLTELGYLERTDDQTVAVTEAAATLSQIYGNADLITAEALRQKLWQGLAPHELASVVSSLVYESRSREDSPARIPQGDVRRTLRKLEELASDLRHLEQSFQVSSLPELDNGFCWAMFRWAQGADLEAVLWESDLTAGDFVRWTRQVIDALGQIANTRGDQVGEAAALAIGQIDRGIVAQSGVHA